MLKAMLGKVALGAILGAMLEALLEALLAAEPLLLRRRNTRVALAAHGEGSGLGPLENKRRNCPQSS